MRFKKNACCAPGLLTRCVTIGLFVAVLSCLSQFAHAQDSSVVRGKVTGAEEGSALSPVSVQNLVTLRGTTTNEKGEFTLVAHKGDSIRFSFAGKASRTVLFRGERLLDIQLTSSDRAMGEVIVTGYQTIAKGRFAGAAATVKMDDARLNGQTDISRMLEGRVAGVSVQNVSGTFGTAPKVRVRGATSINGDNKPLWVVDNVVLEDIVNISNDQLSSGDPTTLLGSAVAGLNSNDIETFDILKDASATALYGARAMNGVVVITTKKGRSGRVAINYSGNFSTYLKPNYSEYNIMNSGEQMSVYAELGRKGALNPDILNRPDYGVYGKMWDLMDSVNNGGNFPFPNTPEARRNFLLRYARANTDWYDLLFRNNFLQEHSVSIATGTDRSQTYFSTSYFGDNGWTIADKVKRYTVNFRNNYKFSDRLSGDFTTVGSVRQQRAPGTLPRQPNPVTGTYDRDFDINPFLYSLNTSRTLTAFNEDGSREVFRRDFAPFNILTELENNYIDINVIDVRLQGGLKYKITPDLGYEFVGALRYVKSTREHQITEKANMANAYRAAGNSTIRQNNKFLYRDPELPDEEPQIVLPYGGFYNRTEDLLASYDFRHNLTYIKEFNEKHAINVLGGQQIKYANRQQFSNTGYGYQYENGGVPFVDYRILKNTIELNFPYYEMSKDFDRFVAFFGTATYTYNDRYNFTATGRYDGSNRLGRSKTARWLPTWSVAGSWNVEKEPFMADVAWVNTLTARASYGLTASLGPATNSQIVLRNINTNRAYLTERESVIQLANVENSELTWEKLYTANVGVDATLFGGRVNVSIDAYKRNSFDLISIIKTSGVGGEAYKPANYADMTSSGIELLIGGLIYNTQDLKWRANLTAGYNVNEITNAQNEPSIWDLVQPEGGNRQGYPVRSLFSLDFQGLQHGSGVPQFIDETGKVGTDIQLQDQNVSHLIYEGPVDPKLTGGLLNSVSYKDFTLSAFITYQAGNRIRLYPAFKNSYTDLDAMPKEFYDRWIFSNDEKYTNVPSIMADFEFFKDYDGTTPFNSYNYSTARIAKGDMIRLKNVSLTWQVPNKMVKAWGMNALSVQAVANNPWLIYSDKKLKGQDPEFFNTGGVAQPIQKQFTLTVRLGL